MKNIYGNFVVIIGDWSDGEHTQKFQISSKTKGWRTTFKRNHIDCFLIDEYKTSSVCPRGYSSDCLEKEFQDTAKLTTLEKRIY